MLLNFIPLYLFYSDEIDQDYNEEELEMEKRALEGIEAERKGKIHIEIDKVFILTSFVHILSRMSSRSARIK